MDDSDADADDITETAEVAAPSVVVKFEAWRRDIINQIEDMVACKSPADALSIVKECIAVYGLTGVTEDEAESTPSNVLVMGATANVA